MFSVCLNCGGILSKTFFINNIFCKFQIRFSPIEHSICHILGKVGPIDVKQKGNESTGCYVDKGTVDIDL